MKELLEKILAEIKKTPGGMTADEDLYHICIETKKTDTGLGVKYLKLLSDCIEWQIPAADSDRDLRFLFNLHKDRFFQTACQKKFFQIPVCFDPFCKPLM